MIQSLRRFAVPVIRRRRGEGQGDDCQQQEEAGADAGVVGGGRGDECFVQLGAQDR